MTVAERRRASERGERIVNFATDGTDEPGWWGGAGQTFFFFRFFRPIYTATAQEYSFFAISSQKKDVTADK